MRCAVFLLLLAVESHAAAPARPIYRCVVDGIQTFSDRPCDASSVEYVPEAQRMSTYEPVPAADRGPGTPPSARPPRADTGSQAAHADKCRRIQARLHEVRNRMRAGYSAKEGERLRERRAGLEEERRREKCH